MSLYKSDNEAQKILVQRLSVLRGVSESEINSKLHTFYLFEYLQQYGRNAADPSTLISWFEREERLGLRGFILSILDYYQGSWIDWCKSYIKSNQLKECSKTLKKQYKNNDDVEVLFMNYLLKDLPKSTHQEHINYFKRKRSLTRGLILSLNLHSPKSDSLVRIYYAEKKGIGSFIKQLGTECPNYIVPYLVNHYHLSYYKSDS